MSDEAAKTVRLSDSPAETLFDLLEEAGTGGMGTVYKARDPVSGRVVAVKLLKAGGDAVRFALEVSALARLHHANIVGYVGHGITEDGRQFLAMDWLEGESLEHRLRLGDAIGLERTLEIARDVAMALEYAHEAGVIHRDLKPSNIFLSKEGVKVLDFGVARISGETGFTQTGQVIGTPTYMAPEQARGDRALGPAADLFSLGCVIYRCVTDESPFAAPDVLGVLTKIASHVPPPLRDVPRPLSDLVAKLLAKDPAARPPSAREVRRTIEAILRGDRAVEHTPTAPTDATLASAPSDTGPAPQKTKKRFPILIGALAAVAVVGVVGIIASAMRTREPQASRAGADSRSTAQRACRTWAHEIVHRQTSDGAFRGEEHRDASGWDTAQELVSLERAASCDGLGPEPLRAGADALLRMKRPDGWLGPHADQTSIPANAWVTMALAEAAKTEPRFREEALRAHALVVAGQREDGSFTSDYRHHEPDFYATLLGAWSLDAIDADASAPARAKALEWLRRCFRPAPPYDVRAAAGLEEQTLWLLAHARGADHSGDDVLRTGAADVIARCDLNRKTNACNRPLYEDSTIGGIVMLWHPWVAAAADALATSTVDFTPEVRADLQTIATWAMTAIDASIDPLAALPEYKLAEYLIALAPLAAPR